MAIIAMISIFAAWLPYHFVQKWRRWWQVILCIFGAIMLSFVLSGLIGFFIAYLRPDIFSTGEIFLKSLEYGGWSLLVSPVAAIIGFRHSKATRKIEDYLRVVEEIIRDNGYYEALLEAQGSDSEFCIELMKFETAAYDSNLSPKVTAGLIIDAQRKLLQNRQLSILFLQSLQNNVREDSLK